MATSAEQLLDQARAHVWAAATALPELGVGRRRTARGLFAGQVAAWPALSRAAVHALESVPLDPAGHLPYERVVSSLRGVERLARPLPGDTVPDGHLLVAARVLGAAGDALQMGGGTTLAYGHDPRTADRVAALVEAAARLTAAYGEQAVQPSSSTAGMWVELAAAAGEAIRTRPTERSSPAALAPVSAPGEASLSSALEAWRSAALDAVARSAMPPTDLPAVAATLSSVYYAAEATGQVPRAGEVARAWMDSLRPWGSALRVPGPRDLVLRAAGAVVDRTLREFVRRHRQGEMDPEGAAALAHFSTFRAPAVGAGYSQAVETLVQSELAVVAARHLVRELRPVPLELVDAARAGRWVPLPRTAAPACELVTTARLAATASGGPAAGSIARVASSFPINASEATGTEPNTTPRPTTRRPSQLDQSAGLGF